MRTWTKVGAGVGALTIALGGYTALDVHDVVPGFLTTAEAPREPVKVPGESTTPSAVNRPSAPAQPSVVPASDGAAPVPAKVAARLRKPLSSKNLGEKVAAVVRDGRTGAHLYDSNAGAAYTPASITKLITAYAVSRTLDMDSRLTTSAVNGRPGEVVVVAGGDSAIAPGAGDPDAINGRAGMGDLADQVATALKRQGRSTVKVGWDLSYAPGPATATRWESGLLDMGFTTRISMLGLSIDRAHPGRASVADPARHAVQAFVGELKKRGVTATVGEPTSAPAGAARLGAVQSAPLVDVVGLALQDSDNALTESLGRQGAFKDGVKGDSASVTAWAIGVLRKAGIDTTGMTMADGSGLSDGTAIPARVFADVLVRGTSGKERGFEEVLSRLPVGGWNGTVDDRFHRKHSVAGRGVTRVKTGSLPGVSSLAGTVVDADGRLLVFTLVTNGQQVAGPNATRAALDSTVAALAGCGCG